MLKSCALADEGGQQSISQPPRSDSRVQLQTRLREHPASPKYCTAPTHANHNETESKITYAKARRNRAIVPETKGDDPQDVNVFRWVRLFSGCANQDVSQTWLHKGPSRSFDPGKLSFKCWQTSSRVFLAKMRNSVKRNPSASTRHMTASALRPSHERQGKLARCAPQWTK